MRPRRAMGVALGALLLVAILLLFRRYGAAGYLPGCAFHHLTGLHCPGCGMTRATYALLHGHMGTAFRFNPLGMIIFPLALTGLGIELFGWVRGQPGKYRLAAGRRGAWIIAWAVLAFWLLRNLPWWPFTLLAPP